MSNEVNSLYVYDACRRVYLETTLLKPRCKYSTVMFDKVSAWSVGQHIEHVLAVNARAVVLLTNPPRSADMPPVAPASEGPLKILETGVIPRGVVQAPDYVLPKLSNYVDLEEDVGRGIMLVDGLSFVYLDIAADANLYAHPILGGLTKLQWLRVLEIHTQHHLKIISDIISRNYPGARSLSASGKLTV